jgi:hypothetical protein
MTPPSKRKAEAKVVGKNYYINLQPSLPKLLGMVREDVREMDWEKLGKDKHSIMVAKADVIQIINEWIAYCLETWPPIQRKRPRLAATKGRK